MKPYTEKEINSLILRFENQELPKSEWTHEAHLVVAIWYTHTYPFERAMDHVRSKITNHNTSVGTPNTETEGYHETITRFWLLLAQNYLRATSNLPMVDLCNGFIQSEQAASSFPLQYYRSETLFSVKARLNWVEPDVKTL